MVIRKGKKSVIRYPLSVIGKNGKPTNRQQITDNRQQPRSGFPREAAQITCEAPSMPIQTFEDLNGKSLVNKAVKLINGYMHYLYKAAKNNNSSLREITSEYGKQITDNR